MKTKSIIANLHTHTVFCDGKASAEEMVQAAMQEQLLVLGFSAHSMYPFSSDWHLEVRAHESYCAEIRRLQLAYADKIRILLGFEADYVPGLCIPRFDCYERFAPDYLIGSVHYIGNEKGIFTVDNTAEELVSGIRRCYNDNVKEAVCDYFAREREMLNRGDFTILGHPDLMRKLNVKLHLFDETDSWYRRAVDETAQAIAKAGVIAEINTGGMVRAGVPTPYPSSYFLSKLHELNVPITISSDAHSPEYIVAQFDVARQYAKAAGYTEYAVPLAGTVTFYSL